MILIVSAIILVFGIVLCFKNIEEVGIPLIVMALILGFFIFGCLVPVSQQTTVYDIRNTEWSYSEWDGCLVIKYAATSNTECRTFYTDLKNKYYVEHNRYLVVTVGINSYGVICDYGYPQFSNIHPTTDGSVTHGLTIKQ